MDRYFYTALALWLELRESVAAAGEKLTDRPRGQAMVEYGLIIAGIAVVVLTALFLMGDRVASLFSHVEASIEPPGIP